MKSRRSLTTLIVSAVFCMTSRCHAEALDLTFAVETAIEPIVGVGIIMKSSGVTQKPGVTFAKTDKGVWKAQFSIDSSEVSEDAFASVLLISSEGDVAASQVRSLTAATAKDIPQCPPQQTLALTADTQIGVLQSLVDVRAARRDNARTRVSETLKGEYLETLKKLESGFGLGRAKELDGNLPPLELVDRLSRILNSIKNYRTTSVHK